MSERQQDAAYLDLVDQRTAFPFSDTDLAVHRAHEVCTSFEYGEVATIEEEVGRWVTGGAIKNRDQIEAMVQSAIEVYCPEFAQS